MIGLDHFQCSEIKPPGSFSQSGVSVVDKFGTFTENLVRAYLICTPASKNGENPRAPTHWAHLTAYQVRTAPFERVNEYLNAADVAFMLRRPDPLNLVASPTKFAEYCLTGLPIVMGNTIEQSYSIARELGNIVELANGGLPAVRVLSDDARRDIVRAAHRRLSRSATRLAYARSYGCSSVAGA